MTRPKIAASSYLNTAPLCYSFERGAQMERSTFISDAAPSRCSDLLGAGEVDAALIPVIEYARVPNVKIAPGACVASKRKVRSVILVSKVPIVEIGSVALDTSSRTSAALVRILLGHFHSLNVEYRSAAPRIQDMLESSDGALIIGVPAMLVPRSSLYVYDLAEEWNRRTGLPFVFAFWAIRVDAVERILESGVDFVAARREGMANIDEISETYQARLGLPREEIVSYLTESISYELDPESLRGLDLFFRLACQCEVIDAVRDVDFLS